MKKEPEPRQIEKPICGNCKRKKSRERRRCYYDTMQRLKVGIDADGCGNFKNKYKVEGCNESQR